MGSSDWYRDSAVLLDRLRDEPPPPPAVASLPGFDDIREFRRGGQAVVYRARQRSTGRLVALKMVHAAGRADPHEQSRFEREIRILGALNHPGIVTIHDSGRSVDGHVFQVMDFIDGVPLDAWVESRRTTRSGVRAILDLFARICDAIHVAHLRGIIHRDLKPSNILIDAAGAPHVLDFGVAKVTDGFEFQPIGWAPPTDKPATENGRDTYARQGVGAAHAAGTGIPSRSHSQDIEPVEQAVVAQTRNSKLETGNSTETPNFTRVGQFIGTLPWAAPEQAAGDPARIDIRTDVYSLGMLLYHALTGTFPYAATGTPRDVLDRIVHAEPIRPRAAVASAPRGRRGFWHRRPAGDSPSTTGNRRYIDDGIEAIVLKCLSKSPESRYENAGALGRDLRHYLAGEPIEARRDNGWYVLRKTLRRHLVPATIAAAFVLLVLCGAVVSTVFWQRAERETRLERDEHNKSEMFARILEDMLDSANLAVARGRDATMLKEMLDETAQRVLNHEYATAPETELRLRLTIGQAYRNLGEYPAAHQVLDDAEALARTCGGEPARVAGAMNILANVLHNEGRWTEALEKSQASLALCDRLGIGDDENRAYALKNVVISLRDLGRFAEALPWSEAALSMARSVWPGDEDMTANGLMNRGLLLLRMRRPTDALPLCEDALAMLERVYHTDRPHAELAKCLILLGQCHMSVGRPDEAVRNYQTALAISRQLGDAANATTANILGLLSEALRRCERPAEAESYATQAVQMCQARLRGGPRRREWAWVDSRCRFWLTHILVDAGRPEDAVMLLRRGLAERDPLPLYLPYHLINMHSLSWALLEQGGSDALIEAEALARESIARCDELGPDGAAYWWLRFDAPRLLGAALAAQGRHAEAEPALLSAYDGLKIDDYTILGPEQVGIDFKRDTAQRIVALYESWHAVEPTKGHDAKAAEWRAKLDESRASAQPAAPERAHRAHHESSVR